MASLAHNHPFVDGNKRTAITSAAMMLRLDDFVLATTNAQLEHFTLYVVTHHPPLDEIAAWLQTHTIPIDRR